MTNKNVSAHEQISDLLCVCTSESLSALETGRKKSTLFASVSHDDGRVISLYFKTPVCPGVVLLAYL